MVTVCLFDKNYQVIGSAMHFSAKLLLIIILSGNAHEMLFIFISVLSVLSNVGSAQRHSLTLVWLLLHQFISN